MAPIQPPPSPPRPTEPTHFGYIDAVRGYAILMVIICHCGGRFVDLPYPVKKLTNFGWFGVQLFFLASAVTLMLSWRRDQRPFGRRTAAFLTRRYFRIAPLYYLAALFYALFDGALADLMTGLGAATFTFVNAWHPTLIPTTPGRNIVPGGWSIGIEFTFYFLLPGLALAITNLQRCGYALLAAILAGSCLNLLGQQYWTPVYGETATNNFLYFWLPNQAFVFLTGLGLHQLLYGPESARLAPLFQQRAWALAALTFALMVTIYAAQNPSRDGFLSFRDGFPLPTVVIVVLAQAIFVLILRFGGLPSLAHPTVQWVGRVSFGAYLVHFAIIEIITGWIDISAVGMAAIGQCALLAALAIPATLIIATALKRLIEDPMIRLGGNLAKRF